MGDTAPNTAADQPSPPPSLAIAKAPSFCRVCNVELGAQQTFRAHVKSDGHVHNLQLKVKGTEPGSEETTFPPSVKPSNKKMGRRDRSSQSANTRSRTRASQNLDITESSDNQDISSDSSDSEDPSATDPFIPSKCLFCPHESSLSSLSSPSSSSSPDSLDPSADILSHMFTAHGFTIPFKDCLAPSVTATTVLEYLHFVTHVCHECILCHGRSRTAEGVQQHMTAKGHCRIDVATSPDFVDEFYDIPKLPPQDVITTALQKQGDGTGGSGGSGDVRLPSGKLISHRNYTHQQEHQARAARRAAAVAVDQAEQPGILPPGSLPTSTSTSTRPCFRTDSQPQPQPQNQPTSSSPPQPPSSSTGLITRQGGGSSNDHRELVHGVRSSEAILAAQLSRLRIAGDRVQQHAEDRRRGRLEAANNSLMRHHFRISAGDSRFGKGFC